MDRDQKNVKLGFMVYQRFFVLNYPGAKAREFLEFMTCRYYTSFTRFGRYMLNISAINPEEFIDFLLKCQIKLVDWEKPLVYETYIRERNKKESADKAVERNILLMQQWAMETGEPWTEFFRKIAPAQATTWIRSGRISPWVLYTAPSATDLLLTRLSDEQRMMIKDYIDPNFWEHKLARHEKEMIIIKQELAEAGL